VSLVTIIRVSRMINTFDHSPAIPDLVRHWNHN
jgi:hypothetical protein